MVSRRKNRVRDAEISRIVLYDGVTLVAAGKLYGISFERVRQIVYKHCREVGLRYRGPSGLTTLRGYLKGGDAP